MEKSIIEKVIMTFSKLKNLYLSFVYKKLISRLAHCRIYHKKEILKFFIANRKCRLLFYQFFDKSMNQDQKRKKQYLYDNLYR